MNYFKPHTIAALVIVLVGGLATAPARAVTDDLKSIGALGCQPYGPNTTASELTYRQTGITNPGDTSEYVICQILADAEFDWSSTPGVSANLVVGFRAGSIPGKVACTAYTGTTAAVEGVTYSATVNPAAVNAGVRGRLDIALADPNGAYDMAPPVSLFCTITPKATLATIILNEAAQTNIP